MRSNLSNLWRSRINRLQLLIVNRQSLSHVSHGLKESMRGRFVHVGAEYGLHWRVIKMAFERHILTSAVINSKYIKRHRVLEDASEIVFERVYSAMI